MSLVPRALQRSGFPDHYVARLRRRLETFLTTADLADSALIIDGPGPGLATHFVALALLGPARVARFQRVHSVSGSSYGVLYFVAWHRGQVTLTEADIATFTRANQARHGVGGWDSAARALLRKLLGAPYLFPNDRAEEVLTYGVKRDFVFGRVSELPDNVAFWTYRLQDRELCEIRRDSLFAGWTVAEAIRAVTAVNRIYEPFEKAGQRYVDAVTAPQLRSQYRAMRRQFRHVLFLHMNRDGVQGNTSFVKMHDTGSGRMRVALDFLYFLSGLHNPDVDDAIRVGFAVQPI